jgi:hypothetical protein
MTGKDNFEKKIKGKLDEVYTPYEESAWQSFAPLLDVPKTPIWKRWYMPYLYSTMLFVLAAIWYSQKEGASSNFEMNGPENNLYKADTIYQRDTVWIIDTVYVHKKVLIEESEKIAKINNKQDLNETSSMNHTYFLKEEITSVKPEVDALIQNQKNEGKIEKTESSLKPLAESTISHSLDSLKTSQAFQESHTKNSNGESKPAKNTLMAPSIAPEESFVMKLDKELVEGDTSNLSSTPALEKNKPYFNLEAGLSLLVPVNRQIEYYPSFAQSFNFGLEWENGFGLYTGIIRSQFKGEIDDDDLSTFNSTVLGSLPGRPADIRDIDEIYLTNRQLFFPLELRWRSLYYSGFSFESSFGIVGNYLARQEFQYEFEDRLGLSDQFESITPRQFRFSHLKFGLGTNYLLSGRWGMFLRSHYWLPVSGAGILENRTHGLEVGLGINYFLGR